MTKPTVRKAMGYVRLIGGNLIILGLLLVAIEGLASYILFFRDVMTTRPVAERLHTKYDPELGWVNRPNVYLANMYGPGVYLRTNSQGFRGNHDTGPTVPPGKARIICSGDSFTLGYGVDNDHTWCHLLTTLDPRLETVNMGQGGYGVDQAYLWFKRDGAGLQHQVHLLAFITGDFDRMESATFLGYGKPVLAIEHGALVVKNVPVPKLSYQFSWFISHYRDLTQLRTVQLLERVRTKLGFGRVNTDSLAAKKKLEETHQVLIKMFTDLKRLNEEDSSAFALVYLPTLDDLKSSDPEGWESFLETESRALGIPLINVLDAFRSLPYADALRMFIPKGQVNYPSAAGHLTNEGNALTAKIIYQALRTQPSLSHALARSDTSEDRVESGAQPRSPREHE